MINCIDKLERLGSVLPLVNQHYFIASFSIILSNILSLILKKNRTVNIYTMYVELYHHLCKFSVDIQIVQALCKKCKYLLLYMYIYLTFDLVGIVSLSLSRSVLSNCPAIVFCTSSLPFCIFLVFLCCFVSSTRNGLIGISDTCEKQNRY